MGVLVSGADFQNVAVDTRTAVWVSTVEKTVLSAENLWWSERQLCIKWMRLVYLHSIFSLRFVFYIWWGNRKQRRPYPIRTGGNRKQKKILHRKEKPNRISTISKKKQGSLP